MGGEHGWTERVLAIPRIADTRVDQPVQSPTFAVVLELARSTGIIGSVVDAAGTPVEGAELYARGIRGSRGSRGGRLVPGNSVLLTFLKELPLLIQAI